MRAILTYHSIDASGSPISCHPDAFAEHVEWLASGRITVTTIENLMAMPGDADAVALTFDDAFVNFGDVAAPLLLDRGLPVTVYVVSRLAGTRNSWDDSRRPIIPALPLLDWDALARLQERGVTLGAHSRSHADVSAIDGSALADEIVGSADEIERRTGRRPSTFAYPFGYFSADSARQVRQTYRYGCTTEFRALGPTEEAPLLPRIDMYYFQRSGSLAQWGRPSFAARIRIRNLARRVRRFGTSAMTRPATRTS